MDIEINETEPLIVKGGFGRIFESMYEGSMIGKGPHVFSVWPYVIAHMRWHREHGALVELNPKLLQFIIGSTEKEIGKAIEFLCSPDKDSRSKAAGGRRLLRVGQYLYKVVNGANYLLIRKKDDERYQNAERQARHKDKLKAKGKTLEQAREDAIQEGREYRQAKEQDAVQARTLNDNHEDPPPF